MPLQITAWGDTYAAGYVPAVQGILDQQATLTVQSSICGTTSNVPFNFIATRDYEIMGNEQISCWIFGQHIGPDGDSCQGSSVVNLPAECDLPFPGTGYPLNGLQQPPSSFYASHTSGWGINGNNGADRFGAMTSNYTLKNGWVFDHVTPLDVTMGNNDSFAVVYNSGALPGSPFLQIFIDWRVENCDLLLYDGNIIIYGPVGVPPL